MIKEDERKLFLRELEQLRRERQLLLLNIEERRFLDAQIRLVASVIQESNSLRR
ncbi:hypothetical protein [Bacillus sp. JCM 19041]|uniref:hypothetical protein n=1 Tax=Bacillus sp. JCM 19041 TaxID=1460637 RepID=UPI000AE71CEF